MTESWSLHVQPSLAIIAASAIISFVGCLVVLFAPPDWCADKNANQPYRELTTNPASVQRAMSTSYADAVGVEAGKVVPSDDLAVDGFVDKPISPSLHPA